MQYLRFIQTSQDNVPLAAIQLTDLNHDKVHSHGISQETKLFPIQEGNITIL
jgi:hypothetical protein